MSTVETLLLDRFERSVEELKQYCAIPSVSTDPAYKAEVERAARFVADRMTKAGLERVEILPTEGHPAVVAEWCHAPGAPTVLVYGHCSRPTRSSCGPRRPSSRRFATAGSTPAASRTTRARR
jgi:hypothetical protein